MDTKERACNIIEGTLQDAIESLEEARECMTGWDWSYLSPEDIDEIIAKLKSIVSHVERETA
jgi:hypothetical protein